MSDTIRLLPRRVRVLTGWLCRGRNEVELYVGKARKLRHSTRGYWYADCASSFIAFGACGHTVMVTVSEYRLRYGRNAPLPKPGCKMKVTIEVEE